jgi:uncharacterized protein YkwD
MQDLNIIFLSILFWIGSPEKQSGVENWPTELNTAKGTAYMDKLEQDVIYELNKVRINPKRFAEEYLEELQTAFNGKLFNYPGQDPVKTQEGISPLTECIHILKSTDPIFPLQPAEGLTQATAELVKDQQKYGGIGHITRNGSVPQKRIEKYGTWDICSAEDITYGSFEARQIVIALLIDDGVSDRAHRKNILNPCFRFAGVTFGNHPSYLSMCVIDYAGSYQTNPKN